jgi:hypothetical protein
MPTNKEWNDKIPKRLHRPSDWFHVLDFVVDNHVSDKDILPTLIFDSPSEIRVSAFDRTLEEIIET